MVSPVSKAWFKRHVSVVARVQAWVTLPESPSQGLSASRVRCFPGVHASQPRGDRLYALPVREDDALMVRIGGGPAPVRAYIDELLPDVLEGNIEPGRFFDRTVGLDGVPDGYRAMAARESIKVLVSP
jgi:hypothetical protein